MVKKNLKHEICERKFGRVKGDYYRINLWRHQS